MVTVIMQHEVKDFAQWKVGFDADEPNRTKAGIKQLGLYTSVKKITFLILISSFMFSSNLPAQNLANSMRGTVNQQKEVISMFGSFNLAAASADYKTYFNFFTDYAVFTGTDATERWDNKGSYPCIGLQFWVKLKADEGRNARAVQIF